MMTLPTWILPPGIRLWMLSLLHQNTTKSFSENEHLRVLEVTLEPNDEEPVHHHRWPSVFVFRSSARTNPRHGSRWNSTSRLTAM